MNNKTQRRVPASAAWLGGLGAIPFAGLAAVAWTVPDYSALALSALRSYGAIILSFLGGIHWGLAMIRSPSSPSLQALTLSVLPSLVAWVGLLLDPRAGLVLLAAAIIAMLAVDISLTRRGLAPEWYQALRVPLSIVVAICLTAGVLAKSATV